MSIDEFLERLREEFEHCKKTVAAISESLKEHRENLEELQKMLLKSLGAKELLEFLLKEFGGDEKE